MSYILISEEKPPKTKRMGDYEYTKKFDIIHMLDGRIRPINGWIIQLVNKETIVTTAEGRELRTSDEISAFTCGNTKFMSDSYIECFPVIFGESKDADIFSSGAVATCDEEGKLVVIKPPYAADELPLLTAGSITHKGTSVFWSEEKKEAAFHALPWDKHTNEKAAVGLWMLPADLWPDILAVGNDCRNMPIHTVKVTWGYRDNMSRLVSSVVNNSPRLRKIGGSRKTRRSRGKGKSRDKSRDRHRNRL